MSSLAAGGDVCDPPFVGEAASTAESEDFDITGDLLVVGDGSMGLKVYTLAAPGSPEAPALLGSLEMPNDEFANFVKADGDLAVVSTFPGTYLVNLSSPSSPFIIDQLVPLGSRAMAIDGDLIMLGSLNQTFIIDASDVDDPQLYVLDTEDDAYGVGIREGIGYAVINGVLRSYDISDPSNAVLLDELPGMGVEAFRHELTFEGDRLYFTNDNDGIRVVDISDPSDLELITNTLITGVRDIDVEGNIAYAANRGEGTLMVLDFNNPAPAVPILGTVPLPNVPSVRYRSGLMYAEAGTSNLSIYDVTGCPTAPIITSSPSSVLTEDGGPAVEFEVDATYVETYQWRLNGEPISDGGDFSGTTTDILTVQPSAATEGLFDVVVSNAQGDVTSDQAVLGVVGGAGACPGDLDGNGVVDVTDLLQLLGNWGACP